MALKLKSPEVEELVAEVAALTGESETEVVRKAVQERKERLTLGLVPRDRKQEILHRLEEEIWSLIPPEHLGHVPSQEEQDGGAIRLHSTSETA
jgi:antitoxin VapB